jgi:hypothetical protein
MTNKEVNLSNALSGTSNEMSGSATPAQTTFLMAQWLSDFYRQNSALPEDFLTDRIEKSPQVRNI